MKKCAIVYRDERSGKEWWAVSVGDDGCTYCLRQRTTAIPRSTKEASEFYGRNRIKRAQERIDKDKKHRRFVPWYSATIIEYEREPEWYFQLWSALERYGDRCHQEVRKGFPLDPDVEYEIKKGNTRPWIHDLPLSELERYYHWRKEHYKGKLKEEV